MTTHGFAVNVDNDLAPFGWIATCGVDGVADDLRRAREGGAGQGAASMSCFRKRMAFRFAEALGARQRLVTPGAAARARRLLP